MLITSLTKICIQWKSSQFLFPVSTFSARNAWEPNLFCKYKEEKRLADYDSRCYAISSDKRATLRQCFMRYSKLTQLCSEKGLFRRLCFNNSAVFDWNNVIISGSHVSASFQTYPFEGVFRRPNFAFESRKWVVLCNSRLFVRFSRARGHTDPQGYHACPWFAWKVFSTFMHCNSSFPFSVFLHKLF